MATVLILANRTVPEARCTPSPPIKSFPIKICVLYSLMCYRSTSYIVLCLFVKMYGARPTERVL